MVRLWAVIAALLPFVSYATLSLRSHRRTTSGLPSDWQFQKSGVHFDGSDGAMAAAAAAADTGAKPRVPTLKFPDVVAQSEIEKEYQTMPAAAEYGNYNGDKPLHYAPPDCYPDASAGGAALYTGFENTVGDKTCASWASHWNVQLDVKSGGDLLDENGQQIMGEDGTPKQMTNDGTGGLTFILTDPNDKASAYIAEHVPTFGITSGILGISGSGVGNHNFCRSPAIAPAPNAINCEDTATQKNFANSKTICEAQKTAYAQVAASEKPWCLVCTGSETECAESATGIFDAKFFAPATCDHISKCQNAFEAEKVSTEDGMNILSAWIHSGYPADYIYARRALSDNDGNVMPNSRQYLGASDEGVTAPTTNCAEAYVPDFNIEEYRVMDMKGKKCRESIGKLYDNGQNYQIAMMNTSAADFEKDGGAHDTAVAAQVAELTAAKNKLTQIEQAITDLNGAEDLHGRLAYQKSEAEKKIAKIAAADKYAAWDVFKAAPAPNAVPEHYALWCYEHCKMESGAKFFSLTADACGCYRMCDPIDPEPNETPFIYSVKNKWAVQA